MKYLVRPMQFYVSRGFRIRFVGAGVMVRIKLYEEWKISLSNVGINRFRQRADDYCVGSL